MNSSGKEMNSVLQRHHLKTEDLVEAVKRLALWHRPVGDVVFLDGVEVCGHSGGLGGFLSVVLRLRVSYHHLEDPQRKTVELIVKKMPNRGLQSDIVKSCRLFMREKTFYWEVVIIMFRAAGQKVEIPVPKYYHASECCGSDEDVIYLEDLCLSGYRRPDRRFVVDGLDVDHCILAVRTLGKLHALSYATEKWLPRKCLRWLALTINAMTRRENLVCFGRFLGRLVDGFGKVLPYLIRLMKKCGVLYKIALVADRFLLPPADRHGWLKELPVFTRDVIWFCSDDGDAPSIFQRVVEKRISSILTISKEIDGLPRMAEESGMLKAALDKTWAILCRLVRPSRSGFNVLNHGDCWTNNMMFKYEGQGEEFDKPTEVKLIDFQFSRYSHPSIDFLYLLYTSMNRYFREKYFDVLISEYHSSMVAAMKSMHCDDVPISLAELKADLNGEYKPFGVIIGTFFAPALKIGELREAPRSEILPKDAHEEFSNDGNAKEFVEMFASSPKFRSFMEDNVRELVDVIFPKKRLGSLNPYWV